MNIWKENVKPRFEDLQTGIRLGYLENKMSKHDLDIYKQASDLGYVEYQDINKRLICLKTSGRSHLAVRFDNYDRSPAAAAPGSPGCQGDSGGPG